MKTISRILLFLISTGFISMQMACTSEFFMDKYKFSDIEKAEVSNFKAGEFKQIDYAIFLDVINRSKPAIVKFAPYKEVVLSDKNGKTYKFKFSNTNNAFKINGDGFILSKKKSKALTELFDSYLQSDF